MNLDIRTIALVYFAIAVPLAIGGALMPAPNLDKFCESRHGDTAQHITDGDWVVECRGFGGRVYRHYAVAGTSMWLPKAIGTVLVGGVALLGWGRLQ